MMASFDLFLVQYGLLAVFLLLLIKTAGAPIPIPNIVCRSSSRPTSTK